VTESSRKAASVPKRQVTSPPATAPSVSITDQVMEETALAGTSSRAETMEGSAADLAGSKKVESASCASVSA
jgi:hypothetical protein